MIASRSVAPIDVVCDASGKISRTRPPGYQAWTAVGSAAGATAGFSAALRGGCNTVALSPSTRSVNRASSDRTGTQSRGSLRRKNSVVTIVSVNSAGRAAIRRKLSSHISEELLGTRSPDVRNVKGAARCRVASGHSQSRTIEADLNKRGRHDRPISGAMLPALWRR